MNVDEVLRGVGTVVLNFVAKLSAKLETKQVTERSKVACGCHILKIHYTLFL